MLGQGFCSRAALLSPGREPTSVGGTENLLGSHRGYRVAVNGHSHRRRGNYWSQSSAARPLKEGHKLVISAEDDGILFLGLVRFEAGASEEARGEEKWVKEH